MSRGLPWNDEQVALLREMHPSHTFQEIADAFSERYGDTSRMAVKVKSRKLGLPAKTSSPTGKPRATPKPVRASPIPSRHGLSWGNQTAPAKPPSPPPAPVEGPPSLRVPLSDVEDGQCRYSDTDDLTVCGRPTPLGTRRGRPYLYCEAHEIIIRRPT